MNLYLFNPENDLAIAFGGEITVRFPSHISPAQFKDFYGNTRPA